MELRDLLLTLREDVLHDRSDRIEGDDDHLWSDSTLIRYLNEAQRRFARRSLCLRDAQSDITRVSLVALQDTYPLDASIFAVLSARYIGNGDFATTTYTLRPDVADLARVGHSAFSVYRPVDTLYFDVNRLGTLTPSKPVAFSTDEFTNVTDSTTLGAIELKVFPAPRADYAGGVVQLRVIRSPQSKFTSDNLDVVPEVPEDYHLALVDYAAYLALRIVDHELGDPSRAAEYEASFNRRVEEAKRETMRKMFTPQPWGFGRNGFSYAGN